MYIDFHNTQNENFFSLKIDSETRQNVVRIFFFDEPHRDELKGGLQSRSKNVLRKTFENEYRKNYNPFANDDEKKNNILRSVFYRKLSQRRRLKHFRV